MRLARNSGSHGGAVYAGDGHLTILRRCVFTQNVATVAGGAVYTANSAQLRLESYLSYENHAPGNGAGVYLTGFHGVVLESCALWDGLMLLYVDMASLHLLPAMDAASLASRIEASQNDIRRIEQLQNSSGL